jgi:hypothetical protein
MARVIFTSSRFSYFLLDPPKTNYAAFLPEVKKHSACARHRQWSKFTPKEQASLVFNTELFPRKRVSQND